MARLDSYDTLPKAMKIYLSNYGWHFNKNLCDFACSMMRKSDGTKLTPCDKEKAEALFKQYEVSIPQEKIYDAVYVLNMARADYLGSSIVDEQHIVKFVKDYLNDKDGYDEVAMTRFYADCIGKGIGLPWDDVL